MSVLAERSAAGFIDRGIDFDAVYNQHVPAMIGTAVDRFRLSESDAQTVAHEVFLAYYLKAEEIRDVRAWLIGAMCNASRQFLRKNVRNVALTEELGNTPDPRHAPEAMMDQIAARQAFACCTARCQLALSLRYIEGFSVEEVAAALKTTPRYAQNLISRCLQQARDRSGLERKR